ncbi:MAG: hypothetical protein HS126_11240 [Anaerolineales bacterium]|nr:hypothetical protein [Anaerolineales bacterium]
MFSRERFDEEQLNGILFRETLEAVAVTEPYGVGLDGTQISRSSLKMPGTSWLKSARSPTFRPGIERFPTLLTGLGSLRWKTAIVGLFRSVYSSLSA